MPDDIITFTIFFKLDFDKRDSNNALNRIEAFVKDYKAERYRNFGFTFKDEFKNAIHLWNRVKDVAGSDMNCAYFSHATFRLASVRPQTSDLLKPKIGNDLDTSLLQLEDAFASLL